MGKPSSRRSKKAKARTERKRRAAESRRIRAKYPSIVLENEDAPPALLRTLEEGLKGFWLGDSKLFGDSTRRFFRAQKTHGYKRAAKNQYGISFDEWDKPTSTQKVEDVDLCCMSIAHRVGQGLIDKIPGIVQFAPQCAFTVAPIPPYGEDWGIYLSSLLVESTPRGKIYFSKKKYEATIRGVRKPVAFTSHVLRRICDRTLPDWQRYGGMGDAHGTFQCCSHFEPETLRNNGLESLALSFYYPCVQGLRSWDPVEAILDPEEIEEGKHYYWRVGYLPVSFQDDFWVAKTLLLPGFRGTPEARLVWQNKKLPREIKRALSEMGNSVDAPLGLLRWFHRHGVPQIKAFDESLYDISTMLPGRKKQPKVESA